jgi:hypothetical protein
MRGGETNEWIFSIECSFVSDHQQLGYEDDPCMGPGPPLLGTADYQFRFIKGNQDSSTYCDLTQENSKILLTCKMKITKSNIFYGLIGFPTKTGRKK